MAIDLEVVQADSGRTLRKQLLDDDGTPPDLTFAQAVRCRVRPADRSRQQSVTDAAVLDARGAFVEHAFTTEEVRFPGLLIADFIVTAQDGTTRTYPPNGYFEVLVNPVP